MEIFGIGFGSFRDMKQSDEFAGNSDPMNATLPLEIEEFPTPKLSPKGRDESDSIKCTLPSGAISFKGSPYDTNPNACLYVDTIDLAGFNTFLGHHPSVVANLWL